MLLGNDVDFFRMPDITNGKFQEYRLNILRFCLCLEPAADRILIAIFRSDVRTVPIVQFLHQRGLSKQTIKELSIGHLYSISIVIDIMLHYYLQ